MIILRDIYLRIQLEVIAYAKLHIMILERQNAHVSLLILIQACSAYCLGCVTNHDNCISCNEDGFRELNNN